MFGGINPSQMKSMMRQMGIKQEDVPARRVIIEKENSRIIIENPEIQKITVKGQDSYQIAGESREESLEEQIKEEDLTLVAEKTGKSPEEAKKALEEAKGDIAEAILKLSDSS